MIDFQAIFSDPRWRLCHLEVCKPHRLYVRHDDDGKIAVLVLLRRRAEGDWSISKRALHHVTNAEHDKRIAQGHIINVDNTWIVIANAPACEVQARIGNMPPNPGYWGDFYWLNAALQPSAGYYGGSDNEEPF